MRKRYFRAVVPWNIHEMFSAPEAIVIRECSNWSSRATSAEQGHKNQMFNPIENGFVVLFGKIFYGLKDL